MLAALAPRGMSATRENGERQRAVSSQISVAVRSDLPRSEKGRDGSGESATKGRRTLASQLLPDVGSSLLESLDDGTGVGLSVSGLCERLNRGEIVSNLERGEQANKE